MSHVDDQVARDRAVKGWDFTEDMGEVDADYGSGYPNGNNPSTAPSSQIHSSLHYNNNNAWETFNMHQRINKLECNFPFF